MTKKGAKEFKDFDTVRNYRLRALYGIDQLRKYARRKAEEMIQEEEEPDYEEKYLEALKDVAVRKIMAKYYENLADEENYKFNVAFISLLVLAAAFVILLIKGM